MVLPDVRRMTSSSRWAAGAASTSIPSPSTAASMKPSSPLAPKLTGPRLVSTLSRTAERSGTSEWCRRADRWSPGMVAGLAGGHEERGVVGEILAGQQLEDEPVAQGVGASPGPGL